MTTVISFDTRELAALSVDLGNAGSRATGALIPVFREAGQDLVKTWAKNARATSGVHGKHYPDSINMTAVLGRNIVIEVGPDPARPQGGMSFENGSVNQPPHLDGQRATDEILPRLDRRVEAAIAHLGV